ncbi:hypothetical protein AB2B38_001110 [Balneola sp. MJW-20]|uniref:hypothetical protein n=1 Tax=Gracilimonas aurantiaca TaxID=3234185 RepID=UPI0039095462
MALLNSLIILIITFFSTLNAISAQTVQPKDGVLIKSMINDVELGINSESVYLNLNLASVNQTNEELQEQYEREYQQFIDSKGRMIISEPVFLRSTTISVPLEDIRAISIQNGKIQFEYYSSPALKFEDVKDQDGRFILDNFVEEDLLKLSLCFQSYNK